MKTMPIILQIASLMLSIPSWSYTPGVVNSPTAPSYTTPVVHQYTVFPNKINVDNQLYSADLDGISKFMAELSTTNPDLYRKLSPNYRSLMDKERRADWILVGTFIAGAGVALMGTNKPDKQKMDYQIAGGSIGLVLPLLMAPFLYPGRQDVMDFINQHNRENKERPIRLEVGLNFQAEGAQAAITVAF